MWRRVIGRRNIGTRRGAPEALEIVIEARAFAEDVHDEAAIVEKHPFGAGAAFTMLRADAVLAEAFLDRVGDGFELRGAGAGAEQKILRKCGEIAQIEHGNVSRLFVLSGFNRPANFRSKGFPVHR